LHCKQNPTGWHVISLSGQTS